MAGDIEASLAIAARDTIGEGPAWDATRGRFLWSDNERGVIHEAHAENGDWREVRRWALGRPIAAAIPRDAGGLIVPSGTDVLILDEDGTVRPFARIDADPDRVWLNDAKCDPRGRLWAGSIRGDFTPGGALYRIDPDGSATTVLDSVTVSNGLDWSPDGSTFYYVDSLAFRVDAFDFDATEGTIVNRRPVVTFARGDGAPDGMCVDREGGLWVAVVGTGEVRRYSPAGDLLARVRISHPGVTSCAFGGADGGELFITSLGRAMPDVVLDLGFTREMTEAPATAADAGGLFVCRPGPKGPPARPFAG